jgi:hypothetical protein
MIADYPTAPPRLAPFLAQWDYMSEQLVRRLEGLGDAEFLWEPATPCWTVRRRTDGRSRPDEAIWEVDAVVTPPRTIAWSVDHLGWGCLLRADYLVGSHTMGEEDLDWPMSATEGVEFMRRGLDAWRSALDQVTDEDLDTVGRSAYPGGMDRDLPLLDIVWWVNKELLEHAAEIWYARDLYAVTRAPHRPENS